MLGNILLGMVIPIILGVWILRRNFTILILYYPLGVAISASINNIGFNYFWNILPNTHNQSLVASSNGSWSLSDRRSLDDVCHYS